MPSDEETSVKAGDNKTEIGTNRMSKIHLFLSQSSSIRHHNSLPTIVQLDVTCSIDNKINLSKLIEDTIKKNHHCPI